MDNKILKGIALILFGILLCIGGIEINSNISINDLPFSLFGIITGTIGLVMVFRKGNK